MARTTRSSAREGATVTTAAAPPAAVRRAPRSRTEAAATEAASADAAPAPSRSRTRTATGKATGKGAGKAAGRTATGKATPRKGARRGAPEALVVKTGETAWEPAELREVLDELHEQQAHLEEVVHEQEVELSALMRDSGDGAGQDQADVGAATFERDHELTVLRSERDKLFQIQRALGRIDDGTYGMCEECGQAIGKMRLMAFPRATLCMTCKQREERR